MPLLDPPLVIIDAGCRWAPTEAWASLAPAVTVVGFEADAAECARLNEAHAGARGVRFVPLALASRSGPTTVHIAREPACSSLFPPDSRAMRRRPALRVAEEVGRATVDAVALDDWLEREGIARVDAMKLDTQGAELEILRGARRSLGAVRALEVEVSFNSMYEDQALFADVDAHLRRSGFVLWRLGHLVHYSADPDRARPAGEDCQFFDSMRVGFASYEGQLYWGHAFYVAEDIVFGDAPGGWREHVRDACLCGALGFSELTDRALRQALAGAPPAAARIVRAGLHGLGRAAGPPGGDDQG